MPVMPRRAYFPFTFLVKVSISEQLVTEEPHAGRDLGDEQGRG